MFIIIVKPTDYKEIIITFRKFVTTCLNIKNQILSEFNNLTTLNISKDIDQEIDNLAQGEILDKNGKKHKFYKLDDLIINQKDKKND